MSDELGPSGRAIWAAYETDKLSAGHRALVQEYARCADICDRLNGLVVARQEAWALLTFDDMGEVHLSIDKILDQARNQQGMLRTLHSEIRQASIQLKQTTASQQAQAEPEDALAARRREKEERERQLR